MDQAREDMVADVGRDEKSQFDVLRAEATAGLLGA